MKFDDAPYGTNWTTTSLVADGRWTEPSAAGFIGRVLSPDGVILIRQGLIDTGLFAGDLEVPQELVPDADPSCLTEGELPFYRWIELTTDAGPARVTWDESYMRDDCRRPSETRDRLQSLYERLTNLPEYLPPNAWTDAASRLYDPQHFRFYSITQPWHETLGNPPELGVIEWPLGGEPAAFGDVVPSLEWYPDLQIRCAVVTEAEASAITESITDAGVTLTDSMPPGFATGAYLRDHAAGDVVALVLDSMRPDEGGCAEADLNILNCWQIGDVMPFWCAIP